MSRSGKCLVAATRRARLVPKKNLNICDCMPLSSDPADGDENLKHEPVLLVNGDGTARP
jgi:hypothetical protein